ncbi:hypothetical protein AG1IA_10229 [Rhizoctonia solani AG-1 IA]|uniref:Uncharacterized protein n=1 Tax=Thanatephorus cucumeris (strain AG1-IA) TaxID=983506 RepID=L8WC44_THACA|nr:hypothetical protein AG1IA_10229 [Rhizoctonia solani AG-1 IA]
MPRTMTTNPGSGCHRVFLVRQVDSVDADLYGPGRHGIAPWGKCVGMQCIRMANGYTLISDNYRRRAAGII